MSRIHAAVRRAKLMMVDDELVNLKALEKNLRRSGYEDFVTTTDSTQALSLVDQERPDILLLDIMMPEVNGLDVLRALRRRPSSVPARDHPDSLLRRGHTAGSLAGGLH